MGALAKIPGEESHEQDKVPRRTGGVSPLARKLQTAGMREMLIEQIRANIRAAVELAKALLMRGEGTSEIVELIEKDSDAAISRLEAQNRADSTPQMRALAAATRESIVEQIRSNHGAARKRLQELTSQEAHMIFGSQLRRNQLLELLDREKLEESIRIIQSMNSETPPEADDSVKA